MCGDGISNTNLGVDEEVLVVADVDDGVPTGALLADALIGRRANFDGGRRAVLAGRELPEGGLLVMGSETCG